jgi:hypothetical protein
MGFRIEGLDALQARLKKSPKTATRQLARGLSVEAETIMTAAKRLTPVAPDGGTLRSSGHVKPAVIKRKSASVVLGFGGAASDYAEAVHEFPSKFSPPSWQGKSSLNWNAAGTGAKFLEKPVKAAKKGLGRRLVRHLDLF